MRHWERTRQSDVSTFLHLNLRDSWWCIWKLLNINKIKTTFYFTRNLSFKFFNFILKEILYLEYHSHLTVCSYHFTYALQSESTLCSCLNVKELLARNRCDIWSLSDSNGGRTHKHLVHKWRLNHLAELAVSFSQTNPVAATILTCLTKFLMRCTFE